VIETRQLADDKKKVPDGFRTARVKNALDDLRDQLSVLVNLASGISRQLPAAEGGLLVFPQSLEFSEAGVEQTVTLVNLRTVAITNIVCVAPLPFVVQQPALTTLAPMQATSATVSVTSATASPRSARSKLIITADGIEPTIVDLSVDLSYVKPAMPKKATA
jgi:hypothetical protein